MRLMWGHCLGARRTGDAAGDTGDAVKGAWMTTLAGESGDAKEPRDPGGHGRLRGR
jgi:hypothetical protein